MGSVLEPPRPPISGSSPQSKTEGAGPAKGPRPDFEDRRIALEALRDAQVKRASKMDEILKRETRIVAEKQKVFDQSLPGFIIENAAAMNDLRHFRWPKSIMLPSDIGKRYRDVIEAKKSYDIFLRERDDAEARAREARKKLEALRRNAR